MEQSSLITGACHQVYTGYGIVMPKLKQSHRVCLGSIFVFFFIIFIFFIIFFTYLLRCELEGQVGAMSLRNAQQLVFVSLKMNTKVY